MLTSSVLNSITFKNLDGGNPHRWNTLHENRKQAGFTTYQYCQQFNLNDVVYLQFTSDSATVPTFRVYNPYLTGTITGTLASSYTGLDNRYFFNFTVTLSAAFHNKSFHFTVQQGSDLLTSESVLCRDLSTDITNGKIKVIKYTNLDRNESDLTDYFVDWSVVGDSDHYMFFYVEAVDIEMNESDESEILEGSQSKTIISANYYEGIQLKSGGIPEYMVEKIGTASSLDVFSVNDVEYVKDGGISIERFGNSTFKQTTLNLSVKNVIGLNVDDLGATETVSTTDMAIIPKRNTAVTTAGWQVENPDGYMLHSIWIKHAATSVSTTAVVTLGTSIAGTDLIDEVQGSLARADYSTIWKQYSKHYLKNPDAATVIYFSVSGAGSVMDIIVNFDTVTP